MKQLSLQDLAIFCEQISMMIKSGIMLHSGMQMITDDTTNAQRKAVFSEVSKSLAAGESLADALKASSAFPEYMIYMVEIGTKSGKLDSVMTALASYYNRLNTMRENIKSAIVYPFVLIFMMLIVLIFLAAKVLPVFEQVFKSLGTQMSPWAVYIMKAGALFNQYAFILIALLVLLGLASFFVLKTETGRHRVTDFLMGKKTSEKFALSTFSSSMALMLSSGLDMELSLQLSMQAISNQTIKSKIEAVEKLMKEETLSFVDAMGKADLLSNTMTGFLSTGYQAGSIDSAMDYIANIYDEEYQSALMRKVSLIEPVSIVVISILIGTILVSVMFPLLGVLSTIG